MDFGNIPNGVKKEMRKLSQVAGFEKKINKVPCTVTFYFATETDDAVREYAEFVFDLWTRLLPKATLRCKELSAKVYLTNAKKKLRAPWRPVGMEELNTGYTTRRCGKIVVYRQEEWTKVFVHETLHCLNFDAVADAEVTFAWFPHPVALFEAYAEASARILHCEIVARRTGKNFKQLLLSERRHTLENLVRLLRYNGIDYEDLLQPTPPPNVLDYREETNAFAYVVLVAMLLHGPKVDVTVSSVPELLQTIELVRTSELFRAKVAAVPKVAAVGPIRMSAVRLFSSS
jgi:hypothetical protein